ncbi:MAG: FAD-binding oxidoreductase [Deltaproteobacteria bacterium]|nr:FAD-binding oxidoreductase [Deltaproteobacteria bacterium]MBW2015300.1 FAD-binding oxidoreductase [Deltaproteobacteria bacterium]MBW2127832.1 FAD-binding oxidoreductase [Deltaproteobacteria bacterium]MBW2302116.1 FAD-binding oxidoreductase [Deltaproteobacteria bacterium]
MSNWDVIIVGAGSIGVPASMALGEMGVKTLVLDKHPSPGQGENKHAIGGARATHSDPAKILTCLRSLEIFSTWEDRYGDFIEWLQGGYTFPVYRQKEEDLLKGILPIQKQYGLHIDWVGPDRIREIVPGIVTEGLRGGTYSPEDGSVSPLLALNAFYRRALALGVRFVFKEKVREILAEKGKVVGVATEKATYRAPVVLDAAGPYSRDLCRTVGVDMPVVPDSHEGAITEPVEPFFRCMVVDLRPAPGTKNYYFYQNSRGQVIFCITPDPPIVGTDKRETSTFLPQVSARMVKLLPRLKNLRVRRVWRGLYPMSPDGSPLVGWNREVEGLLHATGMCGQGFMLGPGLGEVLARMITGSTNDKDRIILEGFDPYREFKGAEALK